MKFQHFGKLTLRLNFFFNWKEKCILKIWELKKNICSIKMRRGTKETINKISKQVLLTSCAVALLADACHEQQVFLIVWKFRQILCRLFQTIDSCTQIQNNDLKQMRIQH